MIVLERQERVGGRIKTLHFDFQQSPQLRGEGILPRHYTIYTIVKFWNFRVLVTYIYRFFDILSTEDAYVSITKKKSLTYYKTIYRGCEMYATTAIRSLNKKNQCTVIFFIYFS